MKEKFEKVVIAGNSLYTGKVATVLFRSQEKIKVRVNGERDPLWFSEELLRKKYNKDCPYHSPEKEEIVRVVNGEAPYTTAVNVEGKAGRVDWAGDRNFTVRFNDNENNYLYFEVGDVEPIPDQKYAWVVEEQLIKRVQLNFIGLGKNIVWSTADLVYYQDPEVFDDFDDALDYHDKEYGEHEIIDIKR